MKTNLILASILLFAVIACKRGNSSARYLLRSISKTAESSNSTYPKNYGKQPIPMKLIASEQKPDTLHARYFKAQLMISPDYPNYQREGSLDVILKLNLNKYPKSIVQITYYPYPDSLARTRSLDQRLFSYSHEKQGLMVKEITR